MDAVRAGARALEPRALGHRSVDGLVSLERGWFQVGRPLIFAPPILAGALEWVPWSGCPEAGALERVR